MTESLALSRREREIMDVIFERGHVTVRDLTESLTNPPSDSAIRTMLTRLEEKGHVKHRADGPRHVFEATTSRTQARRSAVSRLVKTFFDGSVEQAVSALLSNPRRLDPTELDRLAELIDEKRREVDGR